MKAKLYLVGLLIFSFITSFAQISGTIKISDLFGKKKKDGKSQNIIVWNNENENNRNVYEYLKKTLVTNDTIKIKEIMASRNISFNSPIDKPSTEYPSTILQYCVQNCSLKTTQFILNNGANPNLVVRYSYVGDFEKTHTYDSSNAMYFALGNKDKINLLLKYGCDLNTNKQQLEEDSKHRNYDYKMFISNLFGGKVSKTIVLDMANNSTEKNKITPELISELVAKGADVNFRYDNKDMFGNDTSMSLLMYFIENNFSYDNIKALIENGANINEGKRQSSFEDGRLPIHSAIIKNRFDVLKLLVEKGANINAVNNNYQNQTALALAQKYKRTEMIDYLFMKGGK